MSCGRDKPHGEQNNHWGDTMYERSCVRVHWHNQRYVCCMPKCPTMPPTTKPMPNFFSTKKSSFYPFVSELCEALDLFQKYDVWRKQGALLVLERLLARRVQDQYRDAPTYYLSSSGSTRLFLGASFLKRKHPLQRLTLTPRYDMMRTSLANPTNEV